MSSLWEWLWDILKRSNPSVYDFPDRNLDCLRPGPAKNIPIEDARYALFRVTKDIPVEVLHSIVEASWGISPLDTLKIVFYLRDCRGGKGLREIFYKSLDWIGNRYPEVIIANFENIPFYGRYADLLVFFGTPLEDEMINVYAKRLLDDRITLSEGHGHDISLAAKYAPSEGCFYDKNFKAVTKFAKSLKMNRENYRKVYLSPLRRQLDENSVLVERRLTPKLRETIPFEKVPIMARKKYEKSFQRHQPARYASFAKNRKVKKKISDAKPTVEEILAPYGRYCLLKLDRPLPRSALLSK